VTGQRFTVSLPPQTDPLIGREVLEVRYEDGTVEQLHLHDYDRLYELPGAYEQIVSDRLACISPQVIASMIGAELDRLGRGRQSARVIDIAAGNGVSGEALVAEGLHPVLGTDIVPAARTAALRDRPGVYEEYLTLDLLALDPEIERHLRSLRADVLQCVAPVGDSGGQLPEQVLAAAARLLEPDSLVAYMHDPGPNPEDAVTFGFWRRELGSHVDARELVRRRYVHRRTVNGRPYEMVGVVWRIVRA
jgi:predicted TPR repeat methyltransferase